MQTVTTVGATTTIPTTFESTVGTTPALTVKGPSTGSAKIQSWQFAGVEEAYVGQVSFFPGVIANNIFFFGLSSAAQFLLLNSLGNGALVGVMEHASSFGSINFVTEASSTRLVKSLDCDGQDIITDADADSRWENGTDDEITYVASSTNVFTQDVNRTWQRVGQRWNYRGVSTTQTLAATDMIVGCTNTTAISLTLPSSPVTGQVLTIKDEATASNSNITVVGTIDGATNFIINQDKQSVSLYYNGTNWLVM